MSTPNTGELSVLASFRTPDKLLGRIGLEEILGRYAGNPLDRKTMENYLERFGYAVVVILPDGNPMSESTILVGTVDDHIYGHLPGAWVFVKFAHSSMVHQTLRGGLN